jgi:hypothetical protein
VKSKVHMYFGGDLLGWLGVVSWSGRVSMTSLVKTDRHVLFYHTAPVVD